MPPAQELPARRSLRRPGYDYARGAAYFVTLCTQRRACLFGEITEQRLATNAAGAMIGEQWAALSSRFPSIVLDTFVVMPNHLHGVLFLPSRAPFKRAEPERVENGAIPLTLGSVVGAFKSLTAVLYGRGAAAGAWPACDARLWQRNYYEHIIKDEGSLVRIRAYIDKNPGDWARDPENPAHVGNVSRP